MTATSELRTELCLLLGEAAPPDGRFTQAELDYILGKAGDTYEAAAIGWRLKVDKLIEAHGLVQSIGVGSEKYSFASINDIRSYCEDKARGYESQSTTASGHAAIIAGLAPDSIGLYELDAADDIESI